MELFLLVIFGADPRSMLVLDAEEWGGWARCGPILIPRGHVPRRVVTRWSRDRLVGPGIGYTWKRTGRTGGGGQ